MGAHVSDARCLAGPIEFSPESSVGVRQPTEFERTRENPIGVRSKPLPTRERSQQMGVPGKLFIERMRQGGPSGYPHGKCWPVMTTLSAGEKRGNHCSMW